MKKVSLNSEKQTRNFHYHRELTHCRNTKHDKDFEIIDNAAI